MSTVLAVVDTLVTRFTRVWIETSEMIQADLKDAGIPYVDDAGRFRDFHALRHTTGSWLAAKGVHPKVAQAIMRHSDINLTVSRYTHTLKGQEAQAIRSLPDLSVASDEQQRATGTDGAAATDQQEYQTIRVCNTKSGAAPWGALRYKRAIFRASRRKHEPRWRYRKPRF